MDQINDQFYEKITVRENEDSSITMSSTNVEVKLQDDSLHILAVINISAMEKLQERRCSNDTREAQSLSNKQPEVINEKQRQQLEEVNKGKPA